MRFAKFPYLVLAGMSLFTLTEARAAQNNEVAPARGSLAWFAQKAHSEGKSAITLRPPITEYPPGPASLDLALMDSTVVVATLVDAKPVAHEFEISTWAKYKMIERLSSQSRELPAERDEGWERSLADAPKSMSPLAGNEFLMEGSGGTVVVDGVSITVPGPGPQGLRIGGKYLIFAVFGPSGKVAAGSYGPASYFTVDDSGVLHARFSKLDSDDNFLLHEIRDRANGRLDDLRSLASTVSRVR